MDTKIKKTAGVATSALLLASMGAAGVAAVSPDEGVAAPAEAAVATQHEQGCILCADVQGLFAFTQGAVSNNADLLQVAKASKYLCASEGGAAVAALPADQWEVKVQGAVGNAFEATLGEMAEEGSASIVMGCSCAGNPAGGVASANAEVLGVRFSYIVEQAQVAPGANTVVFTAADGYEMALPLSYVMQKFSLIAFNVNGEPIDNTIGGSCQLWLGSTAASCYVRDVTAITFEERDVVPAAPRIGQNLPNASITDGETL